MISFVIPTLNEIDNIDKTVQKIKQCFNNIDDYEIIFVDDKSEDDTVKKELLFLLPIV